MATENLPGASQDSPEQAANGLDAPNSDAQNLDARNLAARNLDVPADRSQNQPAAKQAVGATPLAYFCVALLGVYLGVLFVKSEVARWERVHDMFLFREPHMYLIIGVAIAVAMVGMMAIKRFGLTTVEGQAIKYKPKPYHTGVVIGGVLFGAGWAITGACPGPIYAQVGAGQWMALLTLAGAMAGMFSYAALKPHLPH